MSSLIHFLNTGAGDCIILESNKHFAMIDAAEDTDYPADKPHLKLKGYEKEVCDYLLKNCADENGVVTLDFILGTHCHSDHIGGFDTIIKHPDIIVKKAFLKPYHEEDIFIMERIRWDNKEVYCQMKAALEEKGVPIIEAFDKMSVKLGDFNITFYNGEYKKTRIKFGENINSVVALVEYNGLKALLAGDMNYRNGDEKRIAEAVGKIDLLKVGHHGYFGSTSLYFIKKLKPQYAVVCNRYSKMYPDVIFKLKHIAKAKIYCTENLNGIISVFDNEKITIQNDIMG